MKHQPVSTRALRAAVLADSRALRAASIVARADSRALIKSTKALIADIARREALFRVTLSIARY